MTWLVSIKLETDSKQCLLWLHMHALTSSAAMSLLCNRAGMSDMFSNCGTVFRFYWWNFAFTCVTLISIGVTACTRLGLHYSRTFWVGMLTTCLFMNMVACEAFLGYEKVR